MLDGVFIHPPHDLEPGHARLGPSSASRWLSCPVSIRLGEEAGPRPGGSAAQVGTVLHAAMEAAIRGVRGGLTDADVMEIVAHDFCPVKAAGILNSALESVCAIVGRFDIGELWLESRVWPLAERGDLWGTADIVGLSRCGTVIVVGDLKTGRGRVDPEYNDQLLLYGLGALRAIGQRAMDVTTIALAIIQPLTMSAGFRVWECDRDLMREFEDYVRAKCAVIDAGGGEPDEGAWCQYCPGRKVCPAHKD
jgi:hypothetical protein